MQLSQVDTKILVNKLESPSNDSNNEEGLAMKHGGSSG